MERCGDCKFFVAKEYTKNNRGECHRYPSVLEKYCESWCGEFVRNSSQSTNLCEITKCLCPDPLLILGEDKCARCGKELGSEYKFIVYLSPHIKNNSKCPVYLISVPRGRRG